MPDDGTMATLFELAIGAEGALQDFYLGLTKAFSDLPEVSEFWKDMMKDEIQHAQELKNICDSLTPDQLRVPAVPYILKKMREILKFSAEDMLKSVKTLEDAYQLAHEFENSELNKIFEFLTTKFISSDKREKFVMADIKKHLMKLVEFSQTFGNTEWRRSIVISSS